MTQLTEDEFVDRFNPETNEDGSLYRQRDWTNPEDLVEIQKASAESRLWTQIDGDGGEWVLSSGYHRVNRNYYVITESPIPVGQDIEVMDEDKPEEDEDEDWDGEGN